MMNIRSVLSLSLLVVGMTVNVASAAPFPDKEIRVIAGFPPGSAAELTLRALVQVAGKYIDQPLVIVNKPGAAQTIAMTMLMSAPADGYTIGMTTETFKSLGVAQYKVPFDPEDLQVLLGYAQFSHVLFTKGDSPHRKYADFLAHARQNPGKVTYGGTGQGSTPDLLGKIFAKEAGIKLTYVPYKGSNEYVPAVLGGQIDSGVITISGISQQVKHGSLAIVVAFGDEKLDGFPDVPTSKELGIQQDLNIFNTILMIVANRNAPADRTKVVEEALRKAALDPEFERTVSATGLKVAYFTSEQVEKRIAETRRLGVPILKDLNLLSK